MAIFWTCKLFFRKQENTNEEVGLRKTTFSEKQLHGKNYEQDTKENETSPLT